MKDEHSQLGWPLNNTWVMLDNICSAGDVLMAGKPEV